jgi:hypothetical protein
MQNESCNRLNLVRKNENREKGRVAWLSVVAVPVVIAFYPR